MRTFRKCFSTSFLTSLGSFPGHDTRCHPKVHLWRGVNRQIKAVTSVPKALFHNTSSREHNKENTCYRLFNISKAELIWMTWLWYDVKMCGTAIGRVQVNVLCHQAPFGSIWPNLNNTLPLSLLLRVPCKADVLHFINACNDDAQMSRRTYFVPNFTSLFKTHFKFSTFNNSF